MVQAYNGHHPFDKKVIENWNNNQGGVYYCGVLEGASGLRVYYVGKAFGNDGIKGRLLQHLSENKWRDVTHFGYSVCLSESEALTFEAQEIRKHKPKYNTQGL